MSQPYEQAYHTVKYANVLPDFLKAWFLQDCGNLIKPFHGLIFIWEKTIKNMTTILNNN